MIGGHLLSASIGLAIFATLGTDAASCALGVGLAITLMRLTDTLHPPAGADPLVILLGGGAGVSFLVAPILVGACALVGLAWTYRRLATAARRRPRRPRAEARDTPTVANDLP